MSTATLGLTPKQQELRRMRLTASKIAAACGLSPWESVLGCYLSYTDARYQMAMSEDMEWGLRDEASIAQKYTEVTGIEVAPAPFYKHPEHDWVGASPDRIAADGSRLVELKASGDPSLWGEGVDDIPEQYLIQTQWQMFAAGFPVCDVAVRFPPRTRPRFAVYSVERNESIIASLFAIGQSFWQRVLDRNPPPPDWTDARTADLIAILYRPREQAKPVVLSEADLLQVEAYERWGEEKRAAEKAQKEIKARLIEALGHATVGELPDGRRIERNLVQRAGYTVEPTEFYDFRIKAPKKGRR